MRGELRFAHLEELGAEPRGPFAAPGPRRSARSPEQELTAPKAHGLVAQSDFEVLECSLGVVLAQAQDPRQEPIAGIVGARAHRLLHVGWDGIVDNGAAKGRVAHVALRQPVLTKPREEPADQDRAQLVKVALLQQ